MRAEIEACFADAPAAELDRVTERDKGHGRIEERCVTVSCEADWLAGTRRFPGELRLPETKTIIRVENRTELKDRCRHDADTSSLQQSSAPSGRHGGARSLDDRERPARTLDVVFNDDQSRLGKGHGAHNMAVVRHFALNLVRALSDKRSIKRRRKVAGWNLDYLACSAAIRAINSSTVGSPGRFIRFLNRKHAAASTAQFESPQPAT